MVLNNTEGDVAMKFFARYANFAFVAGLILTGMACSTVETPDGQAPTLLYERLGGKPAITAVVDEFVGNVAKDARINGRFATTDIPRLKGHLVDQVCAATGGPCTYTGRDMPTTHAGMRITNAEFSALVEDLVAALNSLKVPEAEQNELLDLLGPMKSDIVEIS
jgi:hemoglobin